MNIELIINPLTKETILKKINEILLENDNEKRKDLILKLYALDYIHKRHEHTYHSPIVVFANWIFLHRNERNPTNEEYEEFYNGRVNDYIYKFENMNEYRKVLTNTKLRNLLFNLYYETDMLKRVELFTFYLSPIKIIKPKTISKKEVINILNKHGIYKVGNYHKLENATKDTLLKYCPIHSI
jgi:hypothetical protein